MGLAALMVVVCHVPQYGVAMPYTLGKLFAKIRNIDNTNLNYIVVISVVKC